MSLPRRHFLQIAPLSLLARTAWGASVDAAPIDMALQALLTERLKQEGVALAAARLLPDGRLNLAAANKPGTPAVSADRHGFEIGSISKVFTGLLLAEAAVRGELRLDDAVEAQLGFPLRDSAGQPLRYVDLATHRSGLPRLAPNRKPANEADPYADYREAQMLEALRGYQGSRRRDEAFEYSNYAIGVLAWLLAQRAGQPLTQLMQRRIYTPLGLGQPAERVSGHNAQGGPVQAWNFTEATAGAGAIVMSAAQLTRFGQAALGQFEHPLCQAFALALQEQSPLGPQPGLQMGLGWMLAERGNRRLATHDGATFGFTSSLWLDLSEKRGGLVLSNAAVSVTDIALHLMDERRPLRDPIAERGVTGQTAQSVSAEQLAPLTGIYAASPTFKLTVRMRDGKLYAQATGQGEFELFASGPRRFFARITALEIEFAGDSGQPDSLVIAQGGGRTPFRREGEEARDSVLQPEALGPLAGVYALNAGFKLTVRVKGARLFAQATGQGEFELFGKRGTREFVARVAQLTIRFEAGEPAPALLLEQAGREMRFVRE
jgi:D-alanyl-D-alanine-carboxypeptidase/D-alanyl-D-alanine-endopeptidase